MSRFSRRLAARSTNGADRSYRGDGDEQDHPQQGPDDPQGHDRADQRLDQGLRLARGSCRRARAVPRDRALRGRGRAVLPRLRPVRPLHRRTRHHRRGARPAAPARGLGQGARRHRGLSGPRHQAGGQRQRLGQAPRPRLPQQAAADARPAGPPGHPARVRTRRHRHQGDDLHRPPREPRAQGRARPRQGGRRRWRELRRGDPRAHHAGVRAPGGGAAGAPSSPPTSTTPSSSR